MGFVGSTPWVRCLIHSKTDRPIGSPRWITPLIAPLIDPLPMQDRWLACASQLEAEVPAQLYKTWLKPLVFLGYDETTRVLRIGAPNQFKLNWVRSQYGNRIGELAGEHIDPQARVEFELSTPPYRNSGL